MPFADRPDVVKKVAKVSDDPWAKFRKKEKRGAKTAGSSAQKKKK
jgi:hypothetical protein